MYNTSLKYRRFDQLVDEVKIDFKKFDIEQMIEDHELIKIAQKCTSILGQRVRMTKEVVLEVEKGRVRLPLDFETANFGLLCGQYSVQSILPQGTTVEEVPFPRHQDFNHNVDACSTGTICTTCSAPKPSCSCGKKTCPETVVPNYNPLVPYGDYCVKPRVFMNCKGESYELIQIVKSEVRTYSYTLPLKFRRSSQGITCDCPNLYVQSPDEVYIDKGWLYCSFEEGKVYLNYQGLLEDEDGNLLVPDHPILNEYYEYALKERILENLFIDGEDVERRYRLIVEKLRTARNEATLLVATPNFSELKKMHELNRKSQYNKYYMMFSSFGYLPQTPYSKHLLNNGR